MPSELLKLRDVLDQVEHRVAHSLVKAIETLEGMLKDPKVKHADQIHAAGKIIEMARAKTPLVTVNVNPAPMPEHPRDFAAAMPPMEPG